MKRKLRDVVFLGVLLAMSIPVLAGCGGGNSGGGDVTGSAPGAFSLSSPADSATGVSTMPNLSWSASAGATSYSVQMKSVATTSFSEQANLTTTNYQLISALNANTSYTWQVVASNAYGSETAGPWAFTTTSVEVVDCAAVASSTTVTATSSNTFNPSTVTIAANSVVKWISASNVPHTVTSGTSGVPDGMFDESLPSNGSSVCLRFAAAGTYAYYCTPHWSMGMTGSVTVQ